MTKLSAQKIIIFSAPSGAGKSSIVHHLLKEGLPLAFSISATTRKPRGKEKHGEDYYFLEEADFRKKIEEDAFIEYEEVYPGRFYGSLKTELVRIWNNNQIVLFDIDVHGGMRLKKLFGDQALSIFVKPPSVEELERRLKGRATDTEEAIKERVTKANIELGFANHFDLIILNENLETACEEAFQVVSKFIEL